MPAEFESGFFGGREPAWHGLGIVIDEDVVDRRRALTLAGMDWQVVKIPLVGIWEQPDGNELEVDIRSACATIRADTGAELGTVGPNYTPVQNEALLEFMESLQDTSDAMFHTAGVLAGGRHVWALARVHREVKILGMEEERIDPFLMVTNAHDGTRALTAVVTPVRVVCMNTLRLAISRATSTWAVRHTSGIEGRLQEAREALGITFRYLDQFEKIGAKLVQGKDAKLSKKAFAEFLEQLIPYDEEMARTVAAGEPNRAARNVDEARDVIRSLYGNSPSLQNIQGTKWAAVNAVAEYVDHWKTPRQRNIYGDDGALDERAMAERRFVGVLWANEMKQRSLRLLAPELAHARGDNLMAGAEQ